MAGWIAFADGYGIDRTQVVDVDNWTLAELERMVQAYLRYLQNPHAYPPGSSDPYDTRTDAQAFSQYMLRTYLPTSGPAIDSVEKLLEVCSEEEYLRLLADRGMDVGFGAEQPISAAIGGGIAGIIGGIKNGRGSALGPDKGGGGGGAKNLPAISGWKYHRTPYGREVPVPDTWISYPTRKNNGIIYQRPGSVKNADTIRIMDPGADPRYPNGYIRYYNSKGQPVKLHLKTPGTEPETHFPIDYPGPLPLPKP